MEQAHLTHNHPLSDAACVAVARMVHRALLGAPRSGLRAAADDLAERHPEFRFEGYEEVREARRRGRGVIVMGLDEEDRLFAVAVSDRPHLIVRGGIRGGIRDAIRGRIRGGLRGGVKTVATVAAAAKSLFHGLRVLVWVVLPRGTAWRGEGIAQLTADLFGLPVVVPHTHETASVGAAPTRTKPAAGCCRPARSCAAPAAT